MRKAKLNNLQITIFCSQGILYNACSQIIGKGGHWPKAPTTLYYNTDYYVTMNPWSRFDVSM